MDGFTPIRNGILEHLEQRRMTALEFAIYAMLHMRADWETGVCRTCAMTLAYQFGDKDIKRQIQDVLSRLRAKRYINYPRGVGCRGAYSVLIDKYEPRVGRLCGTRLNAWKHGELSKPEYEPVDGESTESRLRVGCESTLLRSKNKELRNEEGGTARKRACSLPADFRPKDSHQQLAARLRVDLVSAFEQFSDHHLSKGSTFKDWDRALNTWMRNEVKFSAKKDGNGTNRAEQRQVANLAALDAAFPVDR